MTFKDLLVIADVDAQTPARVALGARLAATFGAHLAALHVAVPPRIPEYVRAQLPPEALSAERRALAETAKRVAATVTKAAAASGVAVEMRSLEGELSPLATLHARYADLAIVPQSVSEETLDQAAYGRLAEDLALGSGRPVLAVPQYGRFATIGERVIIAWNGTREAARAVNDALPLLERAKQVTVLGVNPPAAGRIPGADIALHLSRHGVRCEASATHGDDDMTIGDMLLSRAADLAADLIVMGAYGHSRTREVVLGGVTRHMLRHMTVPVLMSH